LAEVGPLTRLANTAIDRPRGDTVAELMRYANTDLLFYRADEKPLAVRQAEGWDPVLAWAREHLGAEFFTAIGVAPIEQPQATLRVLRAALEGESPFVLIGLHAATEIAGSLILSLALVGGRLSAAGASTLSRIDEAHQSERWGIDAIAQKRAEAMARELETVAHFLCLARP
jgi:chaperone required for assembly of F1-ATPase